MTRTIRWAVEYLVVLPLVFAGTFLAVTAVAPTPEGPPAAPERVVTVTVEQLELEERRQVTELLKDCDVIDTPNLADWPTAAVVAWDTAGAPEVRVERVDASTALLGAENGRLWVRAWCR